MASRCVPLLVCLLLAAPSRAGDTPPRPPQAPDGGEVHVYLQPFPADTERITFSIGALAAVDGTGAGTPLALSFATVAAPESRRQRRLASGRLPAGGYAGLSIAIAKASQKREGGEASLLVPDTPFRVDAPFSVSRGRAVVLWLSLGRPASGPIEAEFNPVFTAHVAPLPILSRTGFVSSAGSNSITVFDKRLRQAAAVVPVAGGPSGMALDQRAGRLYVACPREEEILAIDVAATTVVERSRLAPGDGPREVALTPDGRTLLSVNTGSNSVTLFDAQPLTRLERITVGNGPASVAIDPPGRRAFVFNARSSSISVIDLANRNLVATISTESAPLRGRFDEGGSRLYLVHERSPYLTVVDPGRLAATARARLRTGAGAIAVDPRRARLYLAGRDEPRVELYDPNTLLPVDAIRTRSVVSHLAVDAEDSSLYMVSPGTRSLIVASLADRKVVAEIDVGDGPYWVAVMGER